MVTIMSHGTWCVVQAATAGALRQERGWPWGLMTWGGQMATTRCTSPTWCARDCRAAVRCMHCTSAGRALVCAAAAYTGVVTVSHEPAVVLQVHVTCMHCMSATCVWSHKPVQPTTPTRVSAHQLMVTACYHVTVNIRKHQRDLEALLQYLHLCPATPQEAGGCVNVWLGAGLLPPACNAPTR